MKKLMMLTAVGFVILAGTGEAFAAHPQITDDTGTQGKGNTQLEVVGEYGMDKEEGITEKSFEVPTAPFLSYGLTDAMDIVLSIPYASVSVEDTGTTTSARGATDLSVELKVRFYEKNGLSLAVKPGVILPTGDEERGIGNGKTSYSAFFIATKEVAAWAFHVNAGYFRNEYKLQADDAANRKNIWHASIAAQVKVAKDVSVVANTGIERNPDKTSDIDPVFALGGLIYSVTESIDIDLGVKAGLNRPETDITFLAGATWRL
jgi:hypothetical protein